MEKITVILSSQMAGELRQLHAEALTGRLPPDWGERFDSLGHRAVAALLTSMRSGAISPEANP